MGTGRSRPAAPPSSPPPYAFAIDVSNAKYRIPIEIEMLLMGQNVVRRYPARDPVNTWIASLPDVAIEEGEQVHPFIVALGLGLCHSSEVAATSLISGAIKSDISTRNHDSTFFAFDDRGRIVGISVVSVDPARPRDLYREITCTGVRRAGWGRRLDEAIVAYARERGMERIRLTPAGPSARAAHEAVGFQYTEVNEEGEEEMVKELSGAGAGTGLGAGAGAGAGAGSGGRRRTRRRGKRSFRRKNKQWTRHH